MERERRIPRSPPEPSFMEVLEAAMTHAIRFGVQSLEGKSLTDIAQAWENAGQWRMLVILMWMRRLSPSRNDVQAISNAIDFAFRFLGKRSIGLFFDAMGGFFEHRQEEMSMMIQIARESNYASPGKLQAAIFGLSGSHYYNVDRYAEFDRMDIAS